MLPAIMGALGLGASLIGKHKESQRLAKDEMAQQAAYDKYKQEYQHYGQQLSANDKANYERKMAQRDEYNKAHPMFEGAMKAAGLDLTSLPKVAYKERDPLAPLAPRMPGPSQPGFGEQLAGAASAGLSAGAGAGAQQSELDKIIAMLQGGGGGAAGGDNLQALLDSYGMA
jgi:hypothetical protein